MERQFTPEELHRGRAIPALRSGMGKTMHPDHELTKLGCCLIAAALCWYLIFELIIAPMAGLPPG